MCTEKKKKKKKESGKKKKKKHACLHYIQKLRHVCE